MRAVGQRREPRQILIRRLERAEGRGVEDRVPAVNAVAREVERETESQSQDKQERRERQRWAQHPGDPRRHQGARAESCGRDERERARRGPQTITNGGSPLPSAVRGGLHQPRGDGRRGGEDDDSRNKLAGRKRGAGWEAAACATPR